MLYYVGDNIPLSFKIEIKQKDSKPGMYFPPSTGLLKCLVSVASPDGLIVMEDPVVIIDNVVSYELGSGMTRHAGDYAAFFDMTFDTGEEKTHKIAFAVLPRKISTEGEVDKLTKKSTSLEIETALGSTVRSKRKKGKPTKEAYETAQERVGYQLAK